MKTKQNKNRKAFTLVELILASAIGAFILLVAAATLRTNAAAAEAVNKNTLLSAGAGRFSRPGASFSSLTQ